jgi:predicted nucleic acid-binding protein
VGSLILPPGGPVAVDAQIIIYSVERHPVYAPLLDPLWDAVQAGALEAVASELALMETLVRPIKQGDAALVARFDAFVVQPGMRLIPVSPTVLRRAAEVRATSRLRTPDAIHAATALLLGCPLFLTNDRGFRGLAGLPVQILDDLLTP